MRNLKFTLIIFATICFFSVKQVKAEHANKTITVTSNADYKTGMDFTYYLLFWDNYAYIYFEHKRYKFFRCDGDDLGSECDRIAKEWLKVLDDGGEIKFEVRDKFILAYRIIKNDAIELLDTYDQLVRELELDETAGLNSMKAVVSAHEGNSKVELHYISLYQSNVQLREAGTLNYKDAE